MDKDLLVLGGGIRWLYDPEHALEVVKLVGGCNPFVTGDVGIDTSAKVYMCIHECEETDAN